MTRSRRPPRFGSCTWLTELNGIWTGLQCQRPAGWDVDGRRVCGTHKRIILQTWGDHTVTSLRGRKAK